MRRLLVLVALMILSTAFRTKCFGADSSVLTGMVSSEKEPKMEGVLVSAKKVGGTITVTVVSDNQGRFAFATGRLQPGKYHLSIRAVGYDLEDPGDVELTANQTKQANLKLRPTSDLASQLTDAEWLMSIPGTMEQKKSATCMTGCHATSVVTKSKFDAKAFLAVLTEMHSLAECSVYVPGAVRIPVPLPYAVQARPEEDAKLAAYLSSINLSSSPNGKWNFDLKTLPRPKGNSTKVIITEYDTPRREFQPHDVAIDSEGMIWSPDFTSPHLIRLNPKTGEIKEWEYPMIKPGNPAYALDIQFDRNGNPWLAMMDQGGLAKFDKKTERFTTWRIPAADDNIKAHIGMVAVSDNEVWFKDSRNNKVFRLNRETNHIDTFQMPSEFYGMRLDSQGNLFLASMAKSTIGEINDKTGEITTTPVPTPDSGPRRGEMDSQDRFWFGEFRAGKFGMYDTKTKQMKEWDTPTLPWNDMYAAAPDKNGQIWGGGEFTDYIFHLDPNSGKVTTYLLPSLDADIRRVSVDSSTKPPTIWVGEDHQGKIARVEPLQ